MTTTISSKKLSNDQSQSNVEQRHLLCLPSITTTATTTFKPFPQSIIQSIENDRTHRLPHAHSTADLRNLDDTYDPSSSNRKHSLYTERIQRSPSEIRITVYPDDSVIPLTTSRIEIPMYEHGKRHSDASLIELKNLKQNRGDYLRRALLDHRFGRRIHSSFSSSGTLRSINRRRSTQNYRRQIIYLSRDSKWHFVRNHLHDIAMMNETYARMKLIEQDLRWIHLREEISKRVLDMREMSILRQQDDGKVKKFQKTNFDLKAIPIDEVVHVERDGRVYSIGTRDLVLGRLIGDEDVELDTFAQLDARRKFQVKQNLLRQQEGRNRLKKHIAFSFCLCNLSFIVLMFASMFICVMKTIFELKSRDLF